MSKVEFLEMLAKGEFISDTPFLTDAEERSIPDYPFEYLLAYPPEPEIKHSIHIVIVEKSHIYNAFPLPEIDICESVVIDACEYGFVGMYPQKFLYRFYKRLGYTVSLNKVKGKTNTYTVTRFA